MRYVTRETALDYDMIAWKVKEKKEYAMNLMLGDLLNRAKKPP